MLDFPEEAGSSSHGKLLKVRSKATSTAVFVDTLMTRRGGNRKDNQDFPLYCAVNCVKTVLQTVIDGTSRKLTPTRYIFYTVCKCHV